jgi:hypothetical protein
LVSTALAVASVELVVATAPAVALTAPFAAIIPAPPAQNGSTEPVAPSDSKPVSVRSRRAPLSVGDPPARIPSPVDASSERPSIAETPAVTPAIPKLSTAAIDGDLPGITTSIAPPSANAGAAPTALKETTPWGTAADAGVGIGRGSQKAAVATAGFFTRMGKSIARSF